MWLAMFAAGDLHWASIDVGVAAVNLWSSTMLLVQVQPHILTHCLIVMASSEAFSQDNLVVARFQQLAVRDETRFLALA